MENVIKHDAARSHMIRLFSGGDIRVNACQRFASSINSKCKDIQFTSIQNRKAGNSHIGEAGTRDQNWFSSNLMSGGLLVASMTRIREVFRRRARGLYKSV